MDKEDVLKQFNEEYDFLVDILETFKLLCNQYGTGNKVRVSDLDASYNEMKKSLKKIRKLAKEVK